MESDLEGSDSSSNDVKDHVSISLLPDQKRNRKKRFRGQNVTFKLWKMFGGKAAICGIATGLLLLSVLLLAVFARPSSSHETVNTKRNKNFGHDFELVRDASVTEHVQKKEARSLRLPRHLSPIEYLVHLHPNLTTFKFSGKVDVLLNCTESSHNITLHVGRKIEVTSVKVAILENSLALKREVKVASFSPHLPGEMMLISLDEELQPGKLYFLMIEFHSELSRGLSGFYLSKYFSPSGELRYLATTHFEPTDARNAFPCFDEPDMKANFTIVIKREKRHVALANMPLSHTEGCKSDNELCTDHFKQSVKMSTYLVAFVVCDFKSITNSTRRGVKVSVWAPPEQIDQGEFALKVAVEVLQYYEEIFQVDYPLPKQDLIAVPDFPTGAMENWGLITFKLTSILYHPGKSSDSNRQWVAVVVAHELSHQWFGNLVTMKWWNDLWLNEGFASFMENVGVNHVAPEWKMMDQFLLDKFQVSMSLDQLTNSHPIMAQVRDPAQINSLFDSISYDKGASIIRMLQDVLGKDDSGKDVFFKGLQHYLKKYSFSNAETNDLWRCLEQAKQGGKDQGLDVSSMMNTWTSQMGFPVINVSRRYMDPLVLDVQQQRFLIHPFNKPEADSFPWEVPLTYVTQDSPNLRHKVMFKTKDAVVDLPVATDDQSWIKMNAGQTGFYRVNYDENNWRKLADQLNTDHKKFTAADRAGLLEDALNLARSGMLDYDLALDLTPYLVNEKDYVPWMSALNNLAYIASQFSTLDSENNENTHYYLAYKRYIYRLLQNVATDLGWEERNSDTHLERYLRATVLHLVSEYEDAVPMKERKGYYTHALSLFKNWLDNNEPITPNLRSTVYSLGVKDADEATWNKVFDRFLKEPVPSEKRKLMYAVTNIRNKKILQKLLEYSLQDDKVRSQDSVAVIDSIAMNPEGRLIAWHFVQENYKLLFNRYGKGSFDFSRLIKANTAHFNTRKMKEQVSGFFARPDVDQGSGKLAVQQSLESIAANIKWIERYGGRVYEWLTHPSFKAPQQGTTTRHRMEKPKYLSYDEMIVEKYGRP